MINFTIEARIICSGRPMRLPCADTRVRPYISVSLWLILFLAGCAITGPQGYNSIPISRDSGGISAIMDSIYRLRTETLIKTSDGGQDVWAMTGIGLAIAPDLILALNHVVSMGETNGSILNETTYLIGQIHSSNNVGAGFKPAPTELQTLLRDRESDIALFKITGCAPSVGADPCVRPIPIAYGSSADLRIGDVVYLVGNAYRLGLNVRQGIVSALTGQAPSSIFFKPERTFMISNGVIPGDSGGPVLAIRDGQFELVGLAQGMISAAPNLGIALKIEFVMEKLGKYLGSPFYKKGFPDPSQKFSYENF